MTSKDEKQLKEITELLKDEETYNKLHQIGIMRDEIWLLHRNIEHVENNVRELEMQILNKHKISFTTLIGLSIMADRVYENELKKKVK